MALEGIDLVEATAAESAPEMAPEAEAAEPEGPQPHRVADADAALELVIQRKQDAEGEREVHVTKWDRFRKFLKGETVIPEGREHLNNINDAVLFEITESERARYMLALFGQKPLFGLEPVGDEDRETTGHLETFLQHQHDTARLLPETSPWVQIDNALGGHIMLGSMVPKISWDGGAERPRLELDDMQNFLLDPLALKGKGMRYAIHLRTVTYGWVLQRLEEKFYDAAELAPFLAGSIQGQFHEEESETRDPDNPTADEGQEGGANPRRRHDTPVLLTEYWEPDRLIHVLDNRAVAHDGPNPYDLKKIPIWVVPLVPLSDALYGVGAADIGESAQYEINAKANQALDMVDILLNPPFLKRRGANIASNELEFAPGRMWDVTDVERDLKALHIPNQLLGTQNERGGLRIGLKERLGTTQYTQGIPGKDRVAQTIRLLIEQAGQRTGLKAERLFERLVRPWYAWSMALNLQYLGNPESTAWERVMREKPNPFKLDAETQRAPTFEGLLRNLSMPTSYMTGSKVLRQENFTQAVGAMMGNPEIAATLEPTQIALEMFKLFDTPDPQRFFRPGQSPIELEIAEENAEIMQGVQPTAHLQEDHQAHIAGHMELVQALDALVEGMQPEIADAITSAASLHVKAHQQMQMTVDAEAQREQAEATGGGAGGAPPAERSPETAPEMAVERVGAEAGG